MDDLDRLLDGPAADLALAVRKGKVAAPDLIARALRRVRVAAERHGSYLSFADDLASEQAAEVDARVKRGEDLPLAGVPLAVKDNINVEGLPSTAGSKVLAGFVAPDSATCVRKLVAAGAVIVGKTNCDEFGMGSSNENSAYGPVKNPWDPNRVPGGSSGGSAAAVAARAASLAIGTDTGGSVRQPASFCGLVGWKPTYGRISRYGLIAFASSLDQAGALGRTVEDAAIAFSAMAGEDPRDSTCLGTPVPDVLSRLHDGVEGVKVGLLQEADGEGGLDPDVRDSLEAAAAALRKAGASIVTVSVPRVPLAIPIYYLIATAEASSNLARYDGIRYGARRGEEDLASVYTGTRSAGFGPEVKRRILLGTFALSSGYQDAYYGRSQRVRALLRRDFDRAFETVDAILCPTSPETAFKFGAKTDDPLQMYLADVFTVPASLAGLPAISVPSALSREGLPIGMQFIGPADSEPVLFTLARSIERNSAMAGHRPPDAL